MGSHSIPEFNAYLEITLAQNIATDGRQLRCSLYFVIFFVCLHLLDLNALIIQGSVV